MAGKILPAFAAVLIFAASVLANLKDEYDHAAFLDPKESYKLYWSVKDADKSIHFAAEVKTTGWVAFGISAGLSGSMKGADIVVGWVDSKGKGHLKLDFRIGRLDSRCERYSMNTEAQVRLKMPRIREGIDNLQGHFDNCVKSARKNSMTNIESFANNQKPKKIHASGSCSSTIVRLEKDIDSDVERSDEEDKKSSDKEDYSGSDIDLDSLSDVALSDFDSDSEEPVSCHSEGNSDEYDDDARWIAYKVEKADPLCYKHQYGKDETEFFNSIRQLGGRRTVNFIRGPVDNGEGKRGSKQSKETCEMNFGGPSETVCNKHQAGYTIKSGVIKPLSLAPLKLCDRSDAPIKNLVGSEVVHVFPCVLCNAKIHTGKYSNRNRLCRRRVLLGVTADCEEGNKNAFEKIQSARSKKNIEPDLSLLSVIPDCPHVGKSLKASFFNWFLKLGNERGNLSILRNLRNRSTPEVSKVVKSLIPKNDFVRKRDRQHPSAVLALTDESLLDLSLQPSLLKLDYHGPSYGNGWPIEDKKQNYDYVGSSETNGVTVLKFKRKLVTCDKEDRDIPLGTSKVIYAHGPTDTFSKHQTNDRGARSINLLNYVKNVPPPKTAKYFDVISANVLVPSDKTTYWCSAYKFADLVQLTEKQHVVEIEPIIALKDRGVVHHMVLYICKNTFNDSHLNATGSCFDYRNMPPSITECAGISPMFAWAVGGVNFKFPDHVGWSIGAADSLRYFVLETHFDNPTQNNNLVVTNGLRLYYDKPRKYDAATLTVGTFTGRNLIIPPNREKWMITGSCTKTCTSYLKNANALNGDEVKFFASFPHAHTIGKGIWTKMVRNGKEVMEIIRDDNYDFDYQGGESTVDEMCLNFIMYYPNVDLASCSSGYYGGMDSFKKKYGKQGKWGNYTYYHLHGVTWSEPMIDELENIYNRKVNSTIRVLCSGTNGTIKKVVVVNRPVITQALPPPKDVCTDSVGGAVSFQSTGVFALLISCVIASMLLVTIAQ
eukprot:gene3458-1835_t